MMRLASVLFMLVLVSTCMLAGLLAKYTVTSSSQDEARVAAFSVSAANVLADSNSEMDLGAIKPLAVYALDIGNQSEVAVSYDIVLNLSENLPEGIDVHIADNKDGSSLVNVTAEVDQKLLGVLGEKYKFKDVGQMAPNSKTVKYLIFVPNENNTVYNYLGTEAEYEETVDYTIDITFTQID